MDTWNELSSYKNYTRYLLVIRFNINSYRFTVIYLFDGALILSSGPKREKFVSKECGRHKMKRCENEYQK